MSPQCQELNALHSQCVDGGSIKIPARLEKPPEPKEPFILDLLAAEARTFAESFSKTRAQDIAALSYSDPEAIEEVIDRLLSSEDQSLAVSEDELLNIILAAWRRCKVDPLRFLPKVNWAAVSALSKHALCLSLRIDSVTLRDEYPYIWNRSVKGVLKVCWLT